MQRMTQTLVVFLACLANLILGKTQEFDVDQTAIEMMHKATLDQNGAYVLLWTAFQDEILFEVQVKTMGYIGFGISTNGGMIGSDIMIGWIDNSGTAFVTDRFGSGFEMPKIDQIQDYKLISGSKNETHTTLRFSRPYTTCDEKNDLQIEEGTVRIIWAYDSHLPESVDSELNHHQFRGTKSVLLKEQKMNRYLDDATFTLDVTMQTVSLPSRMDTLYWCKLYKVPDLRKKHHIIGFSPIIQGGNEAFVHHMMFYQCPYDEELLGRWASKEGAQCHSKKLPVNIWEACSATVVNAWAVGSEGMFLPDDTGFPVGAENEGSNYFMLEVHYNNPNLKEGVIDSSGMRIFVTENLRRHDGGIISVGTKITPTMIIPQQYPRYEINGYCTQECTDKYLPEEGIKVFGAILHTHLLGRSITLHHFREGKELPPIVKDLNYDFNYQEVRMLSELRTIHPNDSLLVSCIYDSSGKGAPTFGGFRTREEMCFAFMFYYPKASLKNCLSDTPMQRFLEGLQLQEVQRVNGHLNDGFAILEEATIEKKLKSNFSKESIPDYTTLETFRQTEIKKPTYLKGKNIYEYIMHHFPWGNKEVVQSFHKATSSQFSTSCNSATLEDSSKKNQEVTVDYPKFIPYEEQSPVCFEGVTLDRQNF